MNKQIRIIGEVQGVFFRKSTVQKAKELDIKGWVRNEPDGSVLAEIEGHQQAVTVMEAWLKMGPENARVEKLIIQPGEEKGYTGFEIKH
jgi:acylphosphatase